jgi:hypothetical protein
MVIFSNLYAIREAITPTQNKYNLLILKDLNDFNLKKKPQLNYLAILQPPRSEVQPDIDFRFLKVKHTHLTMLD